MTLIPGSVETPISIATVPHYRNGVPEVTPPQKVETESEERMPAAAAVKAAAATREITEGVRRLLNNTRALLGLHQRDWR